MKHPLSSEKDAKKSHRCHLPVGNTQEPTSPVQHKDHSSAYPLLQLHKNPRGWGRSYTDLEPAEPLNHHLPASHNFSPHGAFLPSPRPYNPGAGNATEGGGRKIRPRKTGIQNSCSSRGQPLTHVDEKPRLSQVKQININTWNIKEERKQDTKAN